MIDKRVLFIVGAGASTELGLPTGRQLLTDLSKIAKRPGEIYFDSPDHYNPNIELPDDLRTCLIREAQRRSGGVWGAEFQRLCEIALWISRNAPLAPSIDNLLHSHKSDPDIVLVGKLMIAQCLIFAEANSIVGPKDLRTDDKFAFLKRSKKIKLSDKEITISGTDNWLTRLFWLLAEESSFEDFLKRLANIDFVCFNYDRCIEHYLVNAASSYFKLDDGQVSRTLEAVRVVHPYGSLGDLVVRGQVAHGFGLQSDFETSAQRIRTFTEGVGQDGLHEDVKGRIEAASFILFLGFGFLQLNMDLLFGNSPLLEPEEIVATSLGISPVSAGVITMYIRSKHFQSRKKRREAGEPVVVGELPISFREMGCSQLLDLYHHVLRKV
jgi:hypothetical protein